MAPVWSEMGGLWGQDRRRAGTEVKQETGQGSSLGPSDLCVPVCHVSMCEISVDMGLNVCVSTVCM